MFLVLFLKRTNWFEHRVCSRRASVFGSFLKRTNWLEYRIHSRRATFDDAQNYHENLKLKKGMYVWVDTKCIVVYRRRKRVILFVRTLGKPRRSRPRGSGGVPPDWVCMKEAGCCHGDGGGLAVDRRTDNAYTKGASACMPVRII
jgi:hypothetical protein